MRARAELPLSRRRLPWAGLAVALLLTAVGLELGAVLLFDDPVDAGLAGLRERGGPVPRMVAGRTWVTRQGVEIHSNDLGYRSARAGDTVPPKDPARLRVAVLGDSETFCKRLAWEDCLPGLLEARLPEAFPGRDFEVLAFAIEGTHTGHHLELLRRVVLPLAPDLVILNYALNDIEVFEQDASVVDFGHWSNRSRFVRVLRAAWARREAARLRRAMLERYELAETEGPPSARWAGYYAQLYGSPLWSGNRRRLLEMERLCREAGAAFVVISSTEVTAVESFEPADYPHREAAAAVASLARDLVFVDPLPAFRRAGRPGRAYYVSPGDAHKNALGNRLIAEALLGAPAFRAVVEGLDDPGQRRPAPP